MVSSRIEDPDTQDRNQKIWEARVEGKTLVQIGREFGLSNQRVSEILRRQKSTNIPEEQAESRKRRADFLDMLRRQIVDLIRKPPAVKFSASGKLLQDPETGERVLDYSLRVDAIKLGLELDSREAKLTGTDLTVTASVPLTDPAEVKKANSEIAEKARAAILRRQIEDQVRAEIREEMSRGVIRN